MSSSYNFKIGTGPAARSDSAVWLRSAVGPRRQKHRGPGTGPDTGAGATSDAGWGDSDSDVDTEANTDADADTFIRHQEACASSRMLAPNAAGGT